MNENDRFWRLQYDKYQAVSYDKKHKYEAWQPGRWAANRSAVASLKKYLEHIKSAYEVGAGSAAFSLELFKQYGCEISAIDMSMEAKLYAKQIAEDMQIPLPYKTGDLFKDMFHADLILSLGVIEHFEPQKQKKFIQKCVELSNQYVLVAIPNQESLIFRNYVEWANRKHGQYEEEHQPLTVDKLVEMMKDCGLSIIDVDGFQVFLSEKEFWNETEIEKIPLYATLKKQLEEQIDGWEEFPVMDFSYEDISKMVFLEQNLDKKTRLEYGFMAYVLAEKTYKADGEL